MLRQTLGCFLIFILCVGCRQHVSPETLPASEKIELLLKNKYPTENTLNFSVSDIPILLSYTNSRKVVAQYPFLPVSSKIYPPRELVYIALSSIENIRLGAPGYIHSNLLDTLSQSNQVDIEEVRNLYIEWWDQNKEKTAQELKALPPLQNTPYQWVW